MFKLVCFVLLLHQLAHATCMSCWCDTVVWNHGIRLKTATCPNKSNSIYLQSMCLPFPSQLQGLSHSSWLGLLAGISVQTLNSFWDGALVMKKNIYTYLLCIKQLNKRISAVHIIRIQVEIETQKSKVKLFCYAQYLMSYGDCIICCQAMWFALNIHMMRRDAHGNGEGTGASEGWQASEK